MEPPHATVRIRRASGADTSELVRIINLAYRVEDFFIRGDRIDGAGVRSRLERPGGAFLVIDGPQPATLSAAVHCVIDGERGFFALLAVDPAAQGRGLGRRLVAEVEERCRTAGCLRLDLDVVDLRTELPPFYRRLGFQPDGTAPFPDPAKLRRPAMMLRMTKRLDRATGDHPADRG